MDPAVLREFQKLPESIRDQFSTSIHAVAKGCMPLLRINHLQLKKGLIAVELKINGSPAYRCVYTTKIEGKIHVVYAREKTANGTDKQLIATVTKRLKNLK
jgi:phage-related protein